MSPRTLACLLALLPLAVLAAGSAPHPIPSRAALDAEVAHVMEATQAQGLAMAVIDDGRVLHVVAYTAMQLVEECVLDLDRPVAEYFDRPLPRATC